MKAGRPKTSLPLRAVGRFAASLVSRAVRIRELGTFSVLLVICVGLAIRCPGFSDLDNVLTVSRAFSLVAIMAVGQTLIIVTGGIDLSVGSIFGLSGITTAILVATGQPLWLACTAGVAAGIAFGAVNGLLVTKGRIPPFIATLGTLSVGRTIIFWLTGEGQPVSLSSSNAQHLVLTGNLRNVIPILFMLGATVLGGIYLNYMRAGRETYAVGGGEQAARLSGVSVNTIKLLAYVITGGLCGIAGILGTSILNVGDPTAGAGMELDVIAASVIGGTSLAGGQGTVLGAFLGAAIMGVIKNGLVLLYIPAIFHVGIIGIVIVAAVLFDTWRRRVSSSGG